jgi:hypothetical protein
MVAPGKARAGRIALSPCGSAYSLHRLVSAPVRQEKLLIHCTRCRFVVAQLLGGYVAALLVYAQWRNTILVSLFARPQLPRHCAHERDN